LKELIENLPIGILLEDYGGILACIREAGINDAEEFSDYYRKNTEKLWDLWKELRIDYINKQGLKNCQFETLEELIHYTHHPNLWPDGPDWVEYCIHDIRTAWLATTRQVREYIHLKGGSSNDGGHTFVARNVSIAVNPRICGNERPDAWPVLTVYSDRSKDLDWEAHQEKLEKALFIMELGDQVISPLVDSED